MVSGAVRRCRQRTGRIHHLAHWPQRRRRNTALLRASAPSWAYCQMGRTASCLGGLRSCFASTTHSTPAVCACFRSAGSLAPALSDRIWRGSQSALLLHRLARRGLWEQHCPPVVGKPSEVVNFAAVRIPGFARDWPLLRNMEDSRTAQDRCRGETGATEQTLLRRIIVLEMNFITSFLRRVRICMNLV